MTVAEPRYRVFLRDADYGITERLDLWTKLTIIKRFNRVGTWNLELPTHAKMARFVTPTTGIIVQRDGVTIFSGPAGYTPESYIETHNSIAISGVDDNILLESTARPTPSLAEAPYTNEYDVSTGVASTIMRSLVNRNIGPSAPTEWKIPQLTLAADPLLGSTITARARFDMLITLLAELASTPTATGLGFQILQSNTLNNTVEFSIYAPEDKSVETVFSIELHTAKDYEWKHQTPPANWFIVAGGDDFGINRTVVEDGDATNIAAVGRRIPEFVDARGITDTSELFQKLAEKLATVVTVDTINVTPADIPTIEYGRDYELGDVVTATIRGTPYSRIIREVEIDFSPDKGVLITPTIADPFGTNDDILAQHLYTVENRLSNIERNFNVPDNSIIAAMLHDTMRWEVGDLKHTARSTAQPGWLFCDGSAILRASYSTLFDQIGTLFGAGNGSTTFNIPNFEDRFLMGAGNLVSVGSVGGAMSYDLAEHRHSHSHGLNNHTHSSQAHTHPGSHSHGMVEHVHHMDHTHTVAGGPVGTSTRQDGSNPVASDSHIHGETGNPSTGTKTGDGESTSGGLAFTSTQSDSNAHSASYSGSPSGPSINSSEQDDALNSSATQNVTNPYLAANVMIFTGVV